MMILQGDIVGEVSAGGLIQGELTKPVKYNGEYIIIPSEYEQTVDTEDRYFTANIIVKPIPSNWGKISWDGSVMTIT